MMVSCIDALRYGGQNEQILKRLYENGMENLCDYQPKGIYDILIRDRIQFRFNSTAEELEQLLLSNYNRIAPYISIENYRTNKMDQFNFIQRWGSGIGGVIYRGCLVTENIFQIRITLEKDLNPKNIIGFSVMLYNILKADNRIENMVWFEHGKENGIRYKKPF
jgi:hypothetical protein